MGEVLDTHDIAHECISGIEACELIVLLEDLTEAAVVHDGKVLEQQNVFVELHTRSEQSRPGVLVIFVAVF